MDRHGEYEEGGHQGQPVLFAGEPLETARAAMLMLHGRGAGAEDIIMFAGSLAESGYAFLAPEAPGSAWYPNSFLAPLSSNEPYLSAALQRIESLLAGIQAKGIPLERTVLLGFSQGACLALEYAVRHASAGRYGGIVGWSGGLIGPEGTAWDYPGSLDGTPVFLGCSDTDPHIPRARVDLSAEVLGGKGATVTERIYPGLGHTVNQDEVDFVLEMMRSVAG
jgi:phospholipase/carboxylesterase